MRDYYLILGIARGESDAGIRDAFLELVRQYHPERAGVEAAPRFQQAVEAYQVLSDRARRASYDRRLEDEERSAAGDSITVRGAAAPRRRPPAEPLAAEPVSLMRDFHVTRPAAEDVLARLRSNFVAHERAPQGLDALRLEIVIGPEQAATGGTLTLGVPVFVRCDRCGGRGRSHGYPCPACGSSGLEEEERPARLVVPPGVRDGTLFQLPLTGLGIRNLYLEVRIRVAG